jgi:hypothetical protein
MKLILTALATLLAWSSLASAAIIGSFTPITSEASTTPPAGYVSQSLTVNATTDWLASNLIVNLSQGSIYQDALISGYGPPSSVLVSVLPTTRWDTYVTGSLGLDGGAPASAGGAVDLGGSPASTFSTSHIDLNWFTTATNDIGTFSLGRFTLSSDAQGTFSLRLDSLGQASPFLLTGEIKNGYFSAVPEVSTSVLCGIAGLMVAAGTGMRRLVSKKA